MQSPEARARAARPAGHWRLLAPAFGCWALSAIVIHYPGSALVVGGATIISGGVIAYVLVRRAKKRRGAKATRAGDTAPGARAKSKAFGGALLLCALVLTLCARIAIIEQARDSPQLVEASQNSRSIEAVAKLSGYPESREGSFGGTRSWVRAELTEVAGSKLSAAVPVMLWIPEATPALWAPSQQVVLSGRLTKGAPEARAAYEINVERILSHESRESLHIEQYLRELAAALRVDLREAAAVIPGAELVPGFAVGDTSLVSDDLEDLMLASSLTHLTAVSGSNCALTVGAVTFCAAWCGAGRRLRITIAAIALAGFVTVVGPDSSVQRATVMAAVLLVSQFGGKRGRSLPALGLAMLALLLVDPWQAIQPGFALSVVATCGLLLWTPACEAWIRKRLKLPRVLALPIAVACVAQFACAPLLLLLQAGIPLSGIVANILAAPAAPMGTGVGLLAMLILPMSEPIGSLLVSLASWAARWVEASAAVSELLPGGRANWPGGWGGVLLLALVYVLSAIAIEIGSGRVAQADGARIVRFSPWASLPAGQLLQAPVKLTVWVRVTAGIAAGILVASVIVVPVGLRAGSPAGWSVVACDVGQGDAVLLRDPARPSDVILVDVGDDAEKLRQCLDLFDVREISLLVLTHDDRDHIGAVAEVLDNTGRVLIAPATKGQQTDRQLVRELAEGGLVPEVGVAGIRGSLGDLEWLVIGPNPDEVPGSTNAASLVLYVEIGDETVLLLGDTGEHEQAWLSQRYPGLRAGIVKVAHHGSRDQLTSLYAQLESDVSLISVGENGYGHPNGDLLARLQANGSATLRTDEHGAIALSRTGDGELIAWTSGRLPDA